MATYERVKRNRYYDPPSEFPHVSRNHYEDMQEFHRPLTRMHNANLHDWGIARGLEVSGAIGGSELIVSSGIAIDGTGELISLSPDGQGDIGSNPPGGQHNAVTVPVQLDLISYAPTTGEANYYVTIQFSEILRPSEGSGGRMELVPWIRLQPVSGDEAYVNDGTAIVLAIARIDSGGNLVALLSEDSTVDYRRRVIGQALEELRIQRSTKIGDSVEETISGKIAPGDGGGLQISVPDSSDRVTFALDNGGNFANLELQTNTLVTKDNAGRNTLSFDTNLAALNIGTNGNGGDLTIKDAGDRSVLQFNSSAAELTVGANGNAGELTIKDAGDRSVLRFNSSTAELLIGVTGNEGDLTIRDAANRSVLRFDSNAGQLTIGANGNDGDLTIKDAADRSVFQFDSSIGWLTIGANGNEGDLRIIDSQGRLVLDFDGDTAALRLGANGNEGDLIVRNNAGNESVSIDGGSGNIKLQGQLRDSSNRNVGLTFSQKQDLTDGGVCTLHRHNNSGNATRPFVRWLIADNTGSSGGTVRTVTISPRRRVFAYIAISSMDPRSDFDSGDAFYAEIYRVDGRDDLARNNGYRFGGAHLGADGANSNNRSPFFVGNASSITFRLRSIQNATVNAIAVVFPES